jgi:hypothetical protein
MKPFLASSLASAIAPLFMTAGGGVVLAQEAGGLATPNQAQIQPSQTKVREKQRDSAQARAARNPSNVQARRKPNGAAMAPDTSYNTITNSPTSNAETRRSNPASGQAPAASRTITSPRSTDGGAQPGLSVQDQTGKSNTPESMRIQQNTVRALPPRRELITKGGGSNQPSAVNSPVERNRLDSSAPSRQRLQIDDLSARQAQQPNSPVEPTPTTNPPVSGTVSGNGSSTGTSGSAIPGTPAPSGTIGGPSSSGARSGASGGTSSHSSAGSSSSGGGH